MRFTTRSRAPSTPSTVRGSGFHPLARDFDIPDMGTAYGIQQRHIELMARTEGEVVGYKIGLTSARMQTMCNIDLPISGAILAKRMHRSGVELDLRLATGGSASNSRSRSALAAISTLRLLL